MAIALTVEQVKERIQELKRERHAVLLAHNYQVPDVQDVADFIGDSLALSRQAAAEDVRAWKEEHPDGVVVAYVNTDAAVKAEADYCCTSTNAVKVVQAIPPGKEVL